MIFKKTFFHAFFSQRAQPNGYGEKFNIFLHIAIVIKGDFACQRAVESSVAVVNVKSNRLVGVEKIGKVLHIILKILTLTKNSHHSLLNTFSTSFTLSKVRIALSISLLSLTSSTISNTISSFAFLYEKPFRFNFKFLATLFM